MTAYLIAAALAGAAWADEPAATQPAASTGTAVVSSTPAAVSAPAPAPPRVKSRVVVHKEAADWEPVSVELRPGSGPRRSSFERRVRKIAGAYRGQISPVKASARIYPDKDDHWLVIALYPAALRDKRMHLEARFFIQEGYLEAVKVAAVTVVGAAASPADEREDSFSLRLKGVDFTEQFPSSAETELSVINPGPGRDLKNAGRVKFAAFGDPELGFVNFAWDLAGVSGLKPPQAVKAPKKKKKPHVSKKIR